MYVHGSYAKSASDPVYDRGWRTKSVGVYASRAVYYLTGWPLNYPTRNEGFRSWWATHSDARNCLWYWQQRISHELRRVDAQDQGEQVALRVHNPSVIPDAIKHQIFQRSFSTKGSDRGIGTYSMRLLGEGYLGGKVSFTSSEPSGTTFVFRIPKTWAGRPSDESW